MFDLFIFISKIKCININIYFYKESIKDKIFYQMIINIFMIKIYNYKKNKNRLLINNIIDNQIP